MKYIALLVSFLLFTSAGTAAPYEYADPDALRLSAAVLSDVHMETNNPDRFRFAGETLSGVYAGGNTPDVIAFSGDNTMNGQILEWFLFYGFLARYCRGSDVLVAQGNHDFGNSADTGEYARLSKRAVSGYDYYCGKHTGKVYYSSDYPCARFIVMGSENNAENTVSVISDEQISWLEGELEDCAANGKTAVVINHNLIKGRNGRRSYFSFNLTDNNDRLDAALEQSGANVIYISGHSHFGVSADSLQTYGSVTYINLPSAGNDGNYEADGDGSHGTGLLMEFYDSEILLTFRNFAEGRDLASYSVPAAQV